jgi:hypothetical protein
MQSQTLSDVWSASTHVLVDRLLVRDWQADLPWRDVVPDSLPNELHLLPAVLQLDRLDEAQRQHVQQQLAVEGASEVAPAMLIGSDLSADALARQLARHVVITLADDSRALLRFADPSVFVHLLWVLPLPHLASLCDGVERWSVPFRSRWWELEFSERPEGEWNRLDEAQSVALTHVGLINDVLASLPDIADLKQWWRRSQEVNEWLKLAEEECDLTNPSDCVAFARHGALLGEGFSRHPKLASSLHAAIATPGHYAQATAALSEREWRGVIADIERMNREREPS